MANAYESVQALLNGAFFPTLSTARKKKGPNPDAVLYVRADADEALVQGLGEGAFLSLYAFDDYPTVTLFSSSAPDADLRRLVDAGPLAEALRRFFPGHGAWVASLADAKNRSLLAFRADSYVAFVPPSPTDLAAFIAADPRAAKKAAKAAKAAARNARAEVFAGSVAGRDAERVAASEPSPPVIYIQKTALRAIESQLADASAPVDGNPELVAEPSAGWTIAHPAEFIVSRLFLPPRVTVSAYNFAACPLRLTRKPDWPQDTQRQSFSAGWSFAGQALSIRYHLDYPVGVGAQQIALFKAALAACFREALAFWSSWKRPIDTPSLAESQDKPAATSVYLIGELRGEGPRCRCSVELPSYFVPLILKMTQTAPIVPADPTGLIDLLRANDNLFLLMKGGYRRAFLEPPKGVVPGAVPEAQPFSGLTVFALLSLIDDADKALVIQNCLLTQYDPLDLPFFFLYHVAQKRPDGETAYQLRPAFPLSLAEIERYLSETARYDWRYNISKGCLRRISTAEDLVRLNADAVLRLAQDGAAGRLLLSTKAMNLLRDEILAPIDAAYRKELDELNGHPEHFAPLKGARPKRISGLLAHLTTQALATALLETEGVFELLAKGMSQVRRVDIKAELGVARKRFARGELSSKDVVAARRNLIQLVKDYIIAEDERVV